MIDRKKLGMIIIVIGSMLILFGMQNKLNKRLSYIALFQNNIKELKTFTIMNGKISYKLPSKWSTEIRDLPGGEITYHNEFHSKDNVIYGFVQVWNINDDLKDFLSKSKNVSEKGNQVTDYNIRMTTISNRKWYEVSYNISGINPQVFNAHEYFIKNGNNIIRFSFFVRRENFKENMEGIYNALVGTLKF